MDTLVEQQITQLIAKHHILVFMKGTKDQPNCGFSNIVIQILNSLDVEYATYDVLDNPEIRHGIKEYSTWPTIPQVYINGEFIGGADIILELYENKALFEMIETIANS